MNARISARLMKTSVLAASVAALSLGCMNEREYFDPNTNVGLGASSNNMAVHNGALRGDFLTRRGFNGEAATTGQNDYEFQTSLVQVSRDESQGTGMIILMTSGKTLEQLEVGRHPFSYDAEALEQGTVSVQVCSGQNVQAIDYDQAADEGFVEVSQEPNGGRRVDVHTETQPIDPVTGDRTGAVEVADGSFTFVPGQ